MQHYNILFLFGFPLEIGGHFKSALAIVKNLVTMGHKVYLLAPGGSDLMINQFINAGAAFFTCLELALSRQRPSYAVISSIKEICKLHSIDIIHAQEFKSIFNGYFAAVLLKKGFVYTHAGGPVGFRPPPKTIQSVFYSNELFQGMVERHNLSAENIFVIPARIDIDYFKSAPVSAAFLKKYQLPSSSLKIVMAMRFDKTKRPWLDTVMKLAEHIADSDLDVHIILAGEGALYQDVAARAHNINVRCSGRDIIHLIGPVIDMDELRQLYNYADVVWGHGRGILEAMACKKPAVILGEQGEAELVGPENISDIAYYNFSGRHFRYCTSVASIPVTLLLHRLQDNANRERAGEFCYDYIQQHMDARVGAAILANRVYPQALHKKNSYYEFLFWYLMLYAVSLKRKLTIGFSLRKQESKGMIKTAKKYEQDVENMPF